MARFMKAPKFLCSIVLLLCTTICIVGFSNAESLHELWGIPWETEISELPDAFIKNNVKIETFDNTSYLSENQVVSILGFPLFDLVTECSEETGKLNYINAIFDSRSYETYSALLNLISNGYNESPTIYVSALWDKELTFYSCLDATSDETKASADKLLADNDEVSICACFGNALLTYKTFSHSEPVIWFKLFDHTLDSADNMENISVILNPPTIELGL